MADHGFRVQPATLTAAADHLEHTAADLRAIVGRLDDLGHINLGTSTDAVAAVVRDIRDRTSSAASSVATHADSLHQAHHRYTTYESGCTDSIRGLLKDEP